MAADRGSQNGNARVLCLDEGGLRCLSQIHILKRLMHHVVERETGENNPSNVPEPYQYFDLICGTGMGGILALFLGRLHLVRLLFLDSRTVEHACWPATVVSNSLLAALNIENVVC